MKQKSKQKNEKLKKVFNEPLFFLILLSDVHRQADWGRYGGILCALVEALGENLSRLHEGLFCQLIVMAPALTTEALKIINSYVASQKRYRPVFYYHVQRFHFSYSNLYF